VSDMLSSIGDLKPEKWLIRLLAPRNNREVAAQSAFKARVDERMHSVLSEGEARVIELSYSAYDKPRAAAARDVALQVLRGISACFPGGDDRVEDVERARQSGGVVASARLVGAAESGKSFCVCDMRSGYRMQKEGGRSWILDAVEIRMVCLDEVTGGYIMTIRTEALSLDSEAKNPAWAGPAARYAMMHLAAQRPITQSWMEHHREVGVAMNVLRNAYTLHILRENASGDLAMFSPRFPDYTSGDMIFGLLRECRRIEQFANDLRVENDRLKKELRKTQVATSRLEQERDVLRANVERKSREIADLRRKLKEAGEVVVRPAPEDIAQAEVAALNEEIASLKFQNQQSRELADVMRREIYDLEQRLNLMLRRSDAEMEAAESASLLVPASFSEAEEWAERYLSGRVVLHPRAIKELQASNYHNPARVYEALWAMAHLYWPLLYQRDAADPAAWEQRLDALGLECSPVGTAATARQTANFYALQLEDGRRVVMDMHLKGNSSFDPRFALRIYFCRDDQGKRIVVGHLPMHLPNRLSN